MTRNQSTQTAVGVWVGSGTALGAALGAAFGNVGIGVALGVAIGAAIGAAMGKRAKDDSHENGAGANVVPERKTDSHLALLIGFSCLLVPTTDATAQSKVHEEAIAEAYAEWVQTTNDRDLEAWATFLAPDAVFLPADSPALTDREAILGFYERLFADDLFSLDCRQEQVEVAVSEDIAWASGRCDASFTGAEGGLAHGSSKWVKVWKRQTSGEWKCAANSWSSIAPSP